MTDGTPPPPVLIEVALEAAADEAALLQAIAALAAEDPGVRVRPDPGSGALVIGGSDELHLDRAIEALARKTGATVAAGPPQVAYRETIARRIEVAAIHEEPAGGLVRITLAVRPADLGAGVAPRTAIAAETLPEEAVPAIKRGLASTLRAGVIGGFPVVDLEVEVLGAEAPGIDSLPEAFEIAARTALEDALRQAGPVLLEPIMAVEVTVPADCAGPVSDDFVLRRGRIGTRDGCPAGLVITATVPIANMFGYSASLEGLSRGQGTFTLRFDRYAPVPDGLDYQPTRPEAGTRTA